AVDLTTGDLLWASAEAQVPITVHGDRLYAQAGVTGGELRVLGFDVTRKGKRVFASQRIALPPWVIPPGGPRPSFSPRWDRERSELILRWSASAWPVDALGLRGPGPRKRASGVARIDLESGAVTAEQAQPAPPPAAPPVPAHLEKLAVRWHGATAQHS